MAAVYPAEDLKHDRKVALKVLEPELAAVLGADRFVVTTDFNSLAGALYEMLTGQPPHMGNSAQQIKCPIVDITK